MLSLNQGKVTFALIMFALFFSGCASPESRWEAARALNTISALEEFLSKDGDSEYAVEAQSRLKKLQCEQSWAETQRLNTAASFQAFMAKYPESEYTTEARDRVDQIMFEEAKQAGDFSALNNYMSQYPNGHFVREARAIVEDLSWSKAKKTDTTEVYQDFMTSYPASSHLQEAQQLAESARQREAFLDTLANLNEISEIQDILASEVAQQHISTSTIPQIEKLLASKSDTSTADSIQALKAKTNGTKGSVTISDPAGPLGGGYHETHSSTTIPKGPKKGEMRGAVFIEVGGRRLKIETEFSSDSIPTVPGRAVFGDIYVPKPVLPFAAGSIHRFNGTVVLNGFTFMSKDDPLNRLTFLLTDRGYVYLRGKGSVMAADAGLMFLNFPPSE